MLAVEADRVRGEGHPAGRSLPRPSGPPAGQGDPSQRRRLAQYTSVRFAETLMLAGLAGSVGSVGDAYDNALAETTIGLYKTECIRAGAPFRNGPVRTLGDLEEITNAWVHW